MTLPDNQRKSLAEQLNANALFHEMLREMEQATIERLISATNEQDRIEAQWRVSAARSFRRDCERMVRSKPEPKGAKA